MTKLTRRALSRVAAVCVLLLPGGAAIADVTVQEQTTLQAAIVKAHGTATHRIAGDKERSESEFRCDGIMSILCGKNSTVEIVRLDRDLTWSEEPKKKTYTEIPFPTPAQRRAAADHARAVIEKLNSCPTAAPTPASVDTSKCEISSPTLTVNKTNDVATIVGHEAHRTNLTMTQSCKFKDTGETCDMAYTFDVWLTTDELPGAAERRSFDQNYVRKLGLDEIARETSVGAGQFLAPYADTLKKFSAKTADMKGYPLKSAFKFAYGGAHCASATSAGAGHGATGTGSPTEAGSSAGGSLAASAAGAFASKVIGGLFSKKAKPDEAAAKTTASSESPEAGNGLTTIAEFTIETTALNTETVPPDQFEVPAGWKKLELKQDEPKELPSCPKT